VISKRFAKLFLPQKLKHYLRQSVNYRNSKKIIGEGYIAVALPIKKMLYFSTDK